MTTKIEAAKKAVEAAELALGMAREALRAAIEEAQSTTERTFSVDFGLVDEGGRAVGARIEVYDAQQLIGGELRPTGLFGYRIHRTRNGESIQAFDLRCEFRTVEKALEHANAVAAARREVDASLFGATFEESLARAAARTAQAEAKVAAEKAARKQRAEERKRREAAKQARIEAEARKEAEARACIRAAGGVI